MSKRKPRNNGRFGYVTAGISTTLVLILVGTVVFFGTMADNLSRALRENFTVEVLLSDSLNHEQAYDLQTTLKQQPYTRGISYISKEKATKLQSEALNIDPNEFLGYSPIPASFELQLKAEYADTDSLKKFMPKLQADERVVDVVYPEDLMQNINSNINKVSIVLLVVAALLGFVSLALINNTLRMNIAKRRHSIQIMKLVGAKWSFIRRPFLWQAFNIGFWAGLVADAVLYGGMYGLMTWDKEISALITPTVMLVTLVSVPLIGVILTVISAFFSVNKHLGMSRHEAYLY